MDIDIYNLGREQYRTAVGYNDMDKDEDGFVVLRPTASRVDARKAALTTSIDDLESKLKQFRAEKAAVVEYQKTDAYKESKKNGKGKKHKKARASLLNMVFNNADALAEEESDEDDEGQYKDNKKRVRKENTLDTTYGKRFSPVVSMLHDTITDFDKIAAEIEEELNSTRGQTRNMYRSTQIGNLISAKNSKLSAVKELGSIAKTVSDLEYKKEKDKKANEGTDTTKAISSLGAKYLRGVFDIDDDRGAKSGKKKKKDKGDSSFKKSAKGMGFKSSASDADDDEEEDSVQKPKKNNDKSRADSDDALAKAFAEELMGRKNEFSFTPHERHLNMEGKYTFMVACDPMDPENTWRYIAIDPKTGREIEGFRKEYKDLMPSKKKARMRFDLAKKQCTDLNTSKKYKLMFTD